jgi:hypothetical protein
MVLLSLSKQSTSLEKQEISYRDKVITYYPNLSYLEISQYTLTMTTTH